MSAFYGTLLRKIATELSELTCFVSIKEKSDILFTDISWLLLNKIPSEIEISYVSDIYRYHGENYADLNDLDPVNCDRIIYLDNFYSQEINRASFEEIMIGLTTFQNIVDSIIKYSSDIIFPFEKCIDVELYNYFSISHNPTPQEDDKFGARFDYMKYIIGLNFSPENGDADIFDEIEKFEDIGEDIYKIVYGAKNYEFYSEIFSEVIDNIWEHFDTYGEYMGSFIRTFSDKFLQIVYAKKTPIPWVEFSVLKVILDELLIALDSF